MVWLIGKNGMLGSEIARQLENTSIPFVGTDREVDITNRQELEAFAASNPGITWVVNCAAYTAVEKAETEPELAAKLNATGAGNIAAVAHSVGAGMIHISTDYVFDGSCNTPLAENAPVRPLGVYGQTKYEGEQAVLQYAKTAVILRTAWLYSPYEKNFVKTMLRLGTEKEQLGVVCDQVGTPTYAPHLAKTIVQILPQITPDTHEIYHFTDEGICSWYDLAWYTLHRAQSPCRVHPIFTKDYPTPAKRPAFSVLDKTKIKQQFGVSIPHWTQGVEECLTKLF